MSRPDPGGTASHPPAPSRSAASLFRKVLIANRGEIAVRVARTCHVLGIPTVAVYSAADGSALHVRECDEAVAIGPAEAARSYLDIDAIVSAARRTGAAAIHPGYGFLSQNADFADAVAGAGITFIGPSGAVHRRMGDKRGARRLMAAAGIPIVPGYDGDDQQDETLRAEAARIGWPVMIKPSRGGGGKGMRVVAREADFDSALAAARREGKAAFGDDVMVLERFVERPRHVEVQVLGDGEGNLVHLLERECSIQRRHQKVIEETPSPALTPALREALCAAGVAAARAAGYVNAGTVEFLLDAHGSFFFLEMNTRLQVEHPVTEELTGLDLVRLQIEVAAGKALPFHQDEIAGRGHALECRLYAEDPAQDDLPSPGRILHLTPPEGPGVRFDPGVAAGSEVTVHYDPLLAKVVTHGGDREESIRRMAEALSRTAVLGVVTNLSRLRAILGHPAFRAGDLHTGFLEQHFGEHEGGPEERGATPPRTNRVESPPPLPPELLAGVAAALALGKTPSRDRAAVLPDPWSRLGSWRLE